MLLEAADLDELNRWCFAGVEAVQEMYCLSTAVTAGGGVRFSAETLMRRLVGLLEAKAVAYCLLKRQGLCRGGDIGGQGAADVERGDDWPHEYGCVDAVA